MAETVDSAYIGRLLNMTSRNVEKLVREEIMPRKARGQYEVVPCIQAYIKYLRTLGEGSSLSLASERTRETKLKADILEMQSEKMKGGMYDAEWVQTLWSRCIMDFRSRLLSLPSKISPIAFACKTIQEIQGIAEEFVHEALNELKRIDPSDYARDGKGVEAVEPAPKTKRKRVVRPKQKAKSRVKRGTRKVANRKG